MNLDTRENFQTCLPSLLTHQLFIDAGLPLIQSIQIFYFLFFLVTATDFIFFWVKNIHILIKQKQRNFPA